MNSGTWMNLKFLPSINTWSRLLSVSPCRRSKQLPHPASSVGLTRHRHEPEGGAAEASRPPSRLVVPWHLREVFGEKYLEVLAIFSLKIVAT